MAQVNQPVVGELAPQIIPPQIMEAGDLAGQDVGAPQEPDAANNGLTPLLGSLHGLAGIALSTTEESNPIPLIGSLNGLAPVAQAAAEE
ncbi:hypothetical protein FRC06_000176 [Ceratobasidium sp. 370]|nr:hypothetical protein FRC06_000176 [Ceratobasidium sp. 370]